MTANYELCFRGNHSIKRHFLLSSRANRNARHAMISTMRLTAAETFNCNWSRFRLMNVCQRCNVRRCLFWWRRPGESTKTRSPSSSWGLSNRSASKSKYNLLRFSWTTPLWPMTTADRCQPLPMHRISLSFVKRNAPFEEWNLVHWIDLDGQSGASRLFQSIPTGAICALRWMTMSYRNYMRIQSKCSVFESMGFRNSKMVFRTVRQALRW